jgi:endonuclease V-like protein UPF0215 family
MKPQSRIVGVDDSPFTFEEQEVVLAGAVVRLPAYLEGVLISSARVDGEDATERIAEMIERSKFAEGAALVLLDGGAVGGFNVVDVDELHERLGIPVATVTRRAPDMEAIESALRARFDDWERRLRILTRHSLHMVETEHNPLFVQCIGMGLDEVKWALSRATVRGVIPEPLRVAHLVATAVKRGESHGRA